MRLVADTWPRRGHSARLQRQCSLEEPACVSLLLPGIAPRVYVDMNGTQVHCLMIEMEGDLNVG